MTHDLNRFVAAQDSVFASVLAELQAGRKTSHWMWFIFPQLRELGRSSTARHYGLAGLEEARAYLAHPLLGPRLAQCVQLVQAIHGRSLREVFGAPDDLKFRSCMTLFEAADRTNELFPAALDRWCGGERDQMTLDLLSSEKPKGGDAS